MCPASPRTNHCFTAVAADAGDVAAPDRLDAGFQAAATLTDGCGRI